MGSRQQLLGDPDGHQAHEDQGAAGCPVGTARRGTHAGRSGRCHIDDPHAVLLHQQLVLRPGVTPGHTGAIVILVVISCTMALQYAYA